MNSAIARALERFPSAPQVHRIPDREFDGLLNDLRQAMEEAEGDAERVEALNLGSRHPVWQVRSQVLDFAARWLPLPTAEETILALTHDSVDVMAFKAIRMCGQFRMRAGVTHLVRISGWPSNFTRPGHLRKPVGIGAALTKRALTQTLGSEEHEDLLRLEQEYIGQLREQVRRGRTKPDTRGMALVDGGPCVIGTYHRTDFLFEYRDYIPEQTAELPAFYIDKLPVTNRQYRDFVRSIEESGHATCHPDEPPGKDHWPSHMRDPRFGADDLPVTGIDWYDAHAYASWCGKKLPTEAQWEKAARGDQGLDYPWGNEWREGLANYVETAFGQKIRDYNHWEEVLRSVSDTFPKAPVWPVGSTPGAVSPYGVHDMAGNVWEWTRTNFFSREPMDPFFKGREVLSFTNRPAAFPVIRGGCWTSLPEMLRTFYRGKDLLTDRHYEIGFRCVVEV